MNKDKKVTTKYSVGEKVAATIAQVVKDSGDKYRVVPSRYNRYAKQFGLPTYNRLDLQNFIDDYLIPESKQRPSQGIHWTAFKSIIHNRVQYSDIVGTNETKSEFNNKISRAANTQPVLHQNYLDGKRYIRRFNRWENRILAESNQVLDHIAQDAKNGLHTIPKEYSTRSVNTNKTMIITLADTHLGATVNVHILGYTNRYNITIAKHRWYAYIDRCLKVAKELHIHDIKLICCGDLTEQFYQRLNQRDEAECGLSRQIPIVENLLVSTIFTLEKYYPVDVYMITGNHDRMNGNLFANKYGDTATLLELHYLVAFKKNNIFTKNVTIHSENDNPDEIHDLFLNIRGKNYLFIHGNTRIKQTKNDNISHLQRNKRIDILVYGHYHNFHEFSDDDGRLEISLPSLMGFNEYAKRLGTGAANAAQCAIIAEDNQDPIVIPMNFNNIQK